MRCLHLLLFATFVTASPAQQNRYSLTGQVVFDNQAPVIGAVITLMHPTLREAAEPVLTDSQGRFAVSGLSQGSYLFYAQRNDLGTVFMGESPQGDTATGITLDEKSPTGKILFHIDRPAVIVGTVRDRAGNPVVHQRIEADRRSWSERKAVMQKVNQSAITDEDGRFRMPLLRPGRYRVCANPEEQVLPIGYSVYGEKPQERFFRSCLPDSDIGLKFVSPGATVEADIVLNQRIPVEVSGTVDNLSEGQYPLLELTPANVSGNLATLSAHPSENANRFRIPGVAPGEYWLKASVLAKRPEDGWLSARIPVTVGSSGLTGVKLTLAQPPVIDVVIHAPKDAGEITIGLLEADEPKDSVTNAARQADGSFRIILRHGGRYWVVTREEFCPASARLGKIDALAQALAIAPGTKQTLEVTITNKCGEIDGLAIDRTGKPVPDARALILISGTPEDPGDTMLVNAADDGTFTYKGLTPGTYYLWTWTENDEWQGELENLGTLRAQQTVVQIKAGDKSKVNVKLVDLSNQERKR